MCEHSRMTIADLRKKLGLSLEEFAGRVGLSSKGQMSEIEKGGRCSVAVALRVEEISDGAIPAAQLNPDIAIIERARGISDGIAA